MNPQARIEPKSIDWPAADFTRIPYKVFSDPDFFAQELERVFRGPCWNYLGLDVEIPEPGCAAMPCRIPAPITNGVTTPTAT